MNKLQTKKRRLTHLCLAIASLGFAFNANAHDEDKPGGPLNPSLMAARAQVFKTNPQLVKSIMLGGGFGTELSYAIANNMYSRTNIAAIDDARAKLKIEELGPRTWLLRFPIVNVVVFETDAGLVLIDSGYAPAGPALVEALKKISSKPVHTVVFTHYHADHAFGAWALLAAGMTPQIVTEERFIQQMEEDMRTHGVIARNNQQPPADVPRTWADAVRPTVTFHEKTTLKIGGEDFVLTHARGETEDQIWVSVPGRKVVVAADYFQGFMPNAGNGKRRQRYPEEWAQALLDMVALKPALLLPMHGPAITHAAEIKDRLSAQAEMLNSISQQVVDGLNAGIRRDLVIDSVALPPELAKSADARELYVSAKDIGRMVAQEHSGWWDDIPSHWAPAPVAAQAKELATLAGGPLKLIERALALADTNPALASQLADWAWLSAEQDLAVVQGALKVYAKRVAHPLPTQEALVYAEHMGRLQLKINELTHHP
jgi:glyoxylase-like metal-dependent hydrolase (beta-lactamase superfamily II)